MVYSLVRFPAYFKLVVVSDKVTDDGLKLNYVAAVNTTRLKCLISHKPRNKPSVININSLLLGLPFPFYNIAVK
jgi:hypothetical protein